MIKKEFLVPPDRYDFNHLVADLTEIRRYNSQRFEMEQLTGIVYENFDEKTCVGYKDLTDDEFWVRGHMPGLPLLPGIIHCEAAAQMSSYFVGKFGMMGGEMMGFAGLEDVRFRGIVRPGDRLVVQSKLLKYRKILVTAQFMSIVGDEIVCEGILKGFPLKREYLA